MYLVLIVTRLYIIECVIVTVASTNHDLVHVQHDFMSLLKLSLLSHEMSSGKCLRRLGHIFCWQWPNEMTCDLSKHSTILCVSVWRNCQHIFWNSIEGITNIDVVQCNKMAQLWECIELTIHPFCMQQFDVINITVF